MGSTGHSPSEVMFDRRIRTTLPTLSKNNEPRMYDDDKVKVKHKTSQTRNEFYYNRRYSPRSLPTLKKGDQVRIKNEKDDAWGEPAVVVGTAKTTRSYDAQTETGILRRNRRHFLHIPRDEREKRKEDKDEVLGSTHKPTEEKSPLHINEESSRNAETSVETMPSPPAQNRMATRSEGVRTRSGRLSIPPDRLNL